MLISIVVFVTCEISDQALSPDNWSSTAQPRSSKAGWRSLLWRAQCGSLQKNMSDRGQIFLAIFTRCSGDFMRIKCKNRCWFLLVWFGIHCSREAMVINHIIFNIKQLLQGWQSDLNLMHIFLRSYGVLWFFPEWKAWLGKIWAKYPQDEHRRLQGASPLHWTWNSGNFSG